jgi:hypothetical protein
MSSRGVDKRGRFHLGDGECSKRGGLRRDVFVRMGIGSGPVRRVQLRLFTGQCDRHRCGGGGLDILFDVLEIEGFNVHGPIFGEILRPMNSSSDGGDNL